MNKRILLSTSLLAAVAATIAGWASVSPGSAFKTEAPDEETVVAKNGVTYKLRKGSNINSPLKEGELIVDVPVHIDLGNNFSGDVIGVYAARINEEGDYELYKAYGSKQEYTFSVPEGTYDVLVYASSYSHHYEYLFGEDNAIINEDSNLSYSIADATQTTTVAYRDPDGKNLFKNRNGEQGNCEGIDFRALSYKGVEYIVQAISPGVDEAFSGLITDPRCKAFTFATANLIMNEKGAMYMAFDIDTSKDTCYNEGGKWISYEPQFASNPHTDAWIALCESNPEDLKLFTSHAAYSLCNDKIGWGMGIGKYGIGSTVWSWQNPNSTTTDILPQTSNVGIVADISVTTPFLTRLDDGLMTCGLPRNTVYSNTAEGKFLSMGNPRMMFPVEDVVFGNTAPITLSIFQNGMKPGDFYLNVIGRHGEQREMEENNIYDWYIRLMDEDAITEAFGGQASSLKIWENNELIVGSLSEFSKSWESAQGSSVRVLFEDNNVIVDGIKGTNITELNYTKRDGDSNPPQLTMLQFRDQNDNMTDRFDNNGEGKIEIYAGDFTLKPCINDNSTQWQDCTELADIKVEYAPYGSDDFSPLAVKEIPEMFFMPGYGYFFRGDLSAVSKASSNKWYDVRISLTDPAGNTNVQTISPAFRIENVADGVETIESASQTAFDIYSLDGTCVMRNADNDAIRTLAKGVYIKRSQEKTEKIIVK